MAPKMPVDRAHDMATAVLAAAVSGMTDAGITPQDRRFVSDGDQPAYDCPELAVVVRNIVMIQGDPSGSDVSMLRSLIQIAAVIDVHSVRCVAAAKTVGGRPRPPTVDEIEASSEVVLGDAIAIFDGLVAAYRSGALPRKMTSLTGWSPVPNEGGIGGGVWSLQVGLEWEPGSGP